MKKRLLFGMLALSLRTTTGWSQSVPALDLYVYDPSRINPAFVGSTHPHVFSFYGYTLLSNFRSIDGSKLIVGTYQASYETRLSNLNSGVGFRVTTDRSDSWSQQRISGLYSYQREIAKGKLLGGIEVARQTEVIDFNVSPPTGLSGELLQLDTSTVEGKGWKVNIGAAYQHNNLTIGIAAQHLTISKNMQENDFTQTNDVWRSLQVPFDFHGYVAYVINFSQYLSLHSSIKYAIANLAQEADINAYLSVFETGLLGVSYGRFYNQDFDYIDNDRWRVHGGIKAFGTVECLLQYVPKNDLSIGQGDLLLRMTLGKKVE
jgi:hypothetical protein